ncbi:hypothetical protein SPV_2460 [Streptococcus pneumoniae]|nr:hypothetical protein SPV_2460 [Streptococcus pneumoniae]
MTVRHQKFQRPSFLNSDST